MHIKKLFQSGIFMLLGFVGGMLPSTTVWAHGGASVELDTCVIPMGDGQTVHFTGYTPTLTADQEYCNSIPKIGPTNLVFDYAGKKLRHMTVEFEITKEPEGKRIYYQEPKAHKKGTVDAAIDFNRYGAGKYLAHVTLVTKDKKVDAHLPFTVGMGSGEIPYTMIIGILVAVLGVGSFIYLSDESFKQKVNAALGKEPDQSTPDVG